MVRQYRVHVMESKGMENEHEAECWGTTRTITTSNQVTWLLRANITGYVISTYRQDCPRHPRWNQLTRISIFPIVRRQDSVLTHDTRRCKHPRRALWVHTQELLAFIICPETTQAVAHLAHPCARDTVEESPEAGSANSLLDRLHHAFVTRRLKADLGKVERVSDGSSNSCCKTTEIEGIRLLLGLRDCRRQRRGCFCVDWG
jgi:hypothetical protein